MKIECPNCHLTGNVPDDKASAPGLFATCPKCRSRFELTPAPQPAPPAPKPVVCPKCAASQDGGDICLTCGIVFAKYSKVQELKEQAPPSPSEPELPPLQLLDEPSGSWLRRWSPYLVLLAALAWFFFTPHLAVRSMRAAAEERNAEKLSRYVNFPALKESLKASFNAKMAAEAAKEQNNPMAAFGAALAAAFISPLIDALVTPESLALIVKGEKPEFGKSKKESSKSPAELESVMSYESLNSFVVTIRKKNETQEPLVLVFNREGVFSSWKLTAIRLAL